MEKIKRTAAYCRISTVREAQEGSYEIQEAYFRDKITSSPDMELVGIYGDKGKSGMSIAKRPGMKQLLEDCRTGKIDQVLTKSMSRFARNMGEAISTIKELRRLGVNVKFEEENLDSANDKSDLILSIFAAIAEEESHSISQHMIMAHEQYVLEGRPFGTVPFGFRETKDHKWEINEDQAELVRTAFEMAKKGICYKVIQEKLNRMGNFQWSQGRVKRMLQHVVYKGDYFSHATVCLVPGKPVRNDGYRDRYYLEGHHEAIVSPELFDSVNKMIGKSLLDSSRYKIKWDIKHHNLTELQDVVDKLNEGREPESWEETTAQTNPEITTSSQNEMDQKMAEGEAVNGENHTS